jgi:hypothetical protein
MGQSKDGAAGSHHRKDYKEKTEQVWEKSSSEKKWISGARTVSPYLKLCLY